MNKKLLFAAIITAGLFTACNNDNEEQHVSKYIHVSTQIGNLTRVSTLADGSQEFEDGDKISVYGWTGSSTTAPAANARVVDNAVNTLSGTTWTPDKQMLWADQTTPHYFVGVYPHNETAVADLTAMSYTLNTSDQTASDLLIATNFNGLKATDTPVSLVFDHVMERIVINLTFRNQFDGHPNVSKVVVKDAMTNATVNCLTKAVTANGDKGEVALQPTGVAGQYASIIIPQTGIRTIVITIDGKDYTYTHTEDIALDGGKYTTIGLIVGKDQITLGSVSINDWQKGTEISGGEAQ